MELQRRDEMASEGASKPHEMILEGTSRHLRWVFGRNVERLRVAQGVGKSFFCLMADVSRSTLDKIESGAADPKLSTMCRVSEALAANMAELLQEDPLTAETYPGRKR